MLKAVIVTGATGYLGSQLVKKLVQKNIQVGIIVRPHSDLSVLRDVQSQLVIFRDHENYAALVDFIHQIKPQIIFHLAALFLFEHKPEEISALIESNILFSTYLTEAMREAGVKKLVNTGTSWQHYKGLRYQPWNLYAATKQAFYDILQFYVNAHEFQVINLELFDTYGSDDPRRKLIPILLKHIDQPEPLALSPGEQELNLLHVDDVCAAFLQAANELLSVNKSYFESYMIRSPENYTLQSLVALIQQVIAPRKLLVQFGGKPYRHREVMVLWKQGKVLSHWSPAISLAEGISTMLTKKC